MLLCGAVVGGGRGDWDFFVEAGRALFVDRDLGVYIERPDLQTGPVTLMVAGVLKSSTGGFVLQVLLCAVLGLATLMTIDRLVPPGHAHAVRSFVGMICVALWWPMFGAYGHIDDALVVSAGVGAVYLLKLNRSAHAGVSLGLAVATKPWAVILLPVLVPGRSLWQTAARGVAVGLAVAIAVGSLFWLPIFISHPESMGSLRPTVLVAYDSGLRMIGLAGTGDAEWFRVAQLGLAFATALRAAWLGEREWVLLAGIGVRVATDPGTWPYYTAGALTAALVWDICRGSSRWPFWTLVCLVLLPPDWLVPFESVRGMCRVLLGVAVVTAPEARRLRNAPRGVPLDLS